jgi:putative FmdB family regulatory protein
MPFYEYQCSQCGHSLEALQKISEAPLKKCPACGKNTLKKLLSAPVFRLKGSGWYETDFKTDQERKRNLAGTDKEASDSSATENKAKSDSDSAAKPDTKTQAGAGSESGSSGAEKTAGSGSSSGSGKATEPSGTGRRARSAASPSVARTPSRPVTARPAKRAPVASRSRSKSARSGPTRGRR